jgi:Domain of unknown function (DUF4190)
MDPKQNNMSKTSGLAIASLVLPLALGVVGCIPGIICGHMARSECKRNTYINGDGLALAGLIISYAVFCLSVLATLFIFLTFINITHTVDAALALTRT